MSRYAVDVVVPVHSNVALTRECLESVLALTPLLDRLIVIDDCGPEPELSRWLEELRDRETRVRVLRNERNLGFVRSVNRGLSIRGGDAVVLNSDTRVTKGWLDELVAVASESPRIAAVSPLSNNATLCSVPTYMAASPISALDGHGLELDGLPRFTVVPTLVGFCLLLQGSALDALGLLDPAYGRGYNEENDWCARARRAGFVVARANRALVYHHGGVSFGHEAKVLDRRNARLLVHRYPAYLQENQELDRTLDARVAAHSVTSQVSRPRICIDGLPAMLREAVRADGRVEVVPSSGDAQLVHGRLPETIAQLEKWVGLATHVVVSVPDATRLSLGSEALPFDEALSRRVSGLVAMQGAEAIVVDSEVDRRALSTVEGIATDLFRVVPPGIDMAAAVTARGEDVRAGLPIGAWVATAQLPAVLAAYALFRARVPNGPALIVGGQTGVTGWPAGVSTDPSLGFREASIVLLPSVFERADVGLEAMATGRPTVVAASSPAAEVCGEGAVQLATASPEAIAETLVGLWQGGVGHRASAGAAGQRRAAGLSGSLAARRLIDVYLSVLAKTDTRMVSQRRLVANLLRLAHLPGGRLTPGR